MTYDVTIQADGSYTGTMDIAIEDIQSRVRLQLDEAVAALNGLGD